METQWNINGIPVKSSGISMEIQWNINGNPGIPDILIHWNAGHNSSGISEASF